MTTKKSPKPIAGQQDEPRCQARLDRLIVGVADDFSKEVPEPIGFRTVADTIVRPQGAIGTYGRVRRYESDSSRCKVSIQYNRLAPWLPKFRITAIADDVTGLTPEELDRIISDPPGHVISLLELALDFHPETGVDEDVVIRHCRFGKSRRNKNRGGEGTVRYGSRMAPKLVRCYQKRTIGRYRVELELHSSLLRKLSIRNIDDLPSVADKLWPNHISFTVIRWEKLKAHLVRRYGERRAAELMTEARKHSEVSLRRAIRFLSRSVHNVHRFLGSEITNRDVREALRRWAVEFSREQDGILIQ